MKSVFGSKILAAMILQFVIGQLVVLNVLNVSVKAAPLGVNVVALGSGSFACAITNVGALKCWGDNGSGQLGIGSTVSFTSPQQVVGMSSGVTQVELGSTFACALQDGAVKCWGMNILTPTAVVGLQSGVSKISVGNSHACAIQNGRAKCWGHNSNGQLGNGTSYGSAIVPINIIGGVVQVNGLSSGVNDLSAGDNFTCAIHGAVLKCWGQNNYGQLGAGNTIQAVTPVSVNTAAQFVKISSAGGHTCGITQNTRLYCWGKNTSGQLGNGTQNTSTAPIQIIVPTTGTTSIAHLDVDVGNSHSCTTVQHGSVIRLFCWGANNQGQLGTGSISSALSPTQVNAPLTGGVLKLSAGAQNTCMTVNLNGGQLYCWGGNTMGQLGLGGLLEVANTNVPILSYASPADLVFSGRNNTCRLYQSALKCWGYNTHGQLGATQVGEYIEPKFINGVTANVTHAAIGGAHICYVSGGALKCIGSNLDGQLGVSSTVNPGVIVSVPGMTSAVTGVALGESHSCALQNSMMKCWCGSVQNGGVAFGSTPVTLPGLSTGVTAITGNCAVKNGAVFCFGQHSLSPVLITGLTSGVTDISSTYNKMCAIQNGTLRCFNFSYQQVDEILIGGIQGPVQMVSIGYTHACAVNSNVLKCWGDNAYGQLGNGSFLSSGNQAVVVSGGISTALKLSLGLDHSCVVQSAVGGGLLKCFGKNTYTGNVISLKRTPTLVVF